MSPELTAVEASLVDCIDQDLRVPYYCEENVWRLASRKIRKKPTALWFAVFISNRRKAVPMCQQLAQEDPSRPCFWDYHVILVGVTGGESSVHDVVRVYDIDSQCAYGCLITEYLEESFPFELHDKTLNPMFRVIPASVYLEHFSSNRSHMFDQKTQTWNATPPTYTCIGLDRPTNFDRYIDFSSKNEDTRVYGKVYDLQQFANLEFLRQ